MKAFVSILYYIFEVGYQKSGLEVYRKTFTTLKEATEWINTHSFPKDWVIDEIKIRML